MSTTTNTRGRYKKSEERRQDILEAAFEVFRRSGYAASSLNDIAREVGMSQPGMMHHFDGKLAMLQAVLERRDQLAVDRLAGRRGVDWLRGLVEIDEANRTQRGVVQLYTTLAAEAVTDDHPVKPYFSARFAEVVGTTARAFEEVREDGLLRPSLDPRAAAIRLISTTEGMQLLWLHGHEVDIAAEVRALIDSMLTRPL